MCEVGEDKVRHAKGSNNLQRLHAVCVPYPAQGHVQPMLALANLLHSKGFHITFVNSEYNHRQLLRSNGPNALDGLPSFLFEAISDGRQLPDDDTKVVPTPCLAVIKNFLQPFKKLIQRLNDPSLSPNSPPVTFILSDCIMPFTHDAAQQLGGIPLVLLWTASACGFLGYSQFRSLLDRGIVPFKDSTFRTDGSLDMIIDWVPSMTGMSLKYIPTFMRTTDKDNVVFNFLMNSVERAAQSSAPIIFNTFDALEHDVLEDISKIVGPIYTNGPLQLLLKHVPEDDGIMSLGSGLRKGDSQCLQWLDSQKPRSVLYVSFGSITTMTNEDLVEFAWGLANSKHPFVWVVRPDIVTGEPAIIVPEFLVETKERGLVTNWCDQEKVLSHPSVGGFLTHNGWNSTVDAICAGVPMLCWPFFAEQQTNCWYSCNKWGIGTEVDGSVKREDVERQVREVMEGEKGNETRKIDGHIGREEVERQVRELMEGEKGKEMRKNAMEWKRLAEEAAAIPSGSSYSNLDKLINQVLLPLKNHSN